jgi:hypothetical protein
MAAKAEKEEDQTIILKRVRLSFAHLFEPQKMTDNKTGKVRWSYTVNALIPKKLPDGTTNPVVKQLQDAMKKALEKTWPGEKKVIPPDRRCVRDGEPIDPDTIDPDVPGSGERNPLYEGYAGHIFVSANRSVEGPDVPNPVQLLGPRKTAVVNGKPAFPRLKKSDGMLYSGCFADVAIRIYGFDGRKLEVPDRINASLEAVKFVEHGEAFGAKPIDADNAFDEEDGDDDDDLMSGSTSAKPKPADDFDLDI